MLNCLTAIFQFHLNVNWSKTSYIFDLCCGETLKLCFNNLKKGQKFFVSIIMVSWAFLEGFEDVRQA